MSDKKVALITGCSSGIGYVTALKLAREGYKVFASVRNTKSEGSLQLEKIAKENSLDLQIVQVDVTEEKTIYAAIKHIEETTEKIDVLINNAGFGALGPVEAFEIDEIKDQYETNVFGTLRMIKAVAPLMRKQKSGFILNISSINGLVSFPLWGIYASSKFAIEAFTESLRFELGQFGIKVVLIEPGAFLTGFEKHRKLPRSLKNNESPYKKMSLSFFNKFDGMSKKAEDGMVSKLMNSQRVAEKICRVLQLQNPPLHNRIGFDSHLYYFAKRLIPNFLMESMLHRIYE